MIYKVVAYIIRRRPPAASELLVFAHDQMPEVPIQVPAGTVDPGETPEIALFREIEEEAGLTILDIKLLRKLGIRESIKANQAGQQHFYLLETLTETPDRWDHEVQGSGLDAGLIFCYYWAAADWRTANSFEVEPSQAEFLNPAHLPELFGLSNLF